MTIRECAQKTGMSETGFHQALSRETLSLAVYEKICELIGVSPSIFFEESSPLMIQVNNNRVGNGNSVTLASTEVKAIKQRIKDLEEIVRSKDETIASLRTQIELLTKK